MLNLSPQDETIHYIGNSKTIIFIQLVTYNEDLKDYEPINLSGATLIQVTFVDKLDYKKKEVLDFIVDNAAQGICKRLTQTTDFSVPGKGEYLLQVTAIWGNDGKEVSSIPAKTTPQYLLVEKKLGS